MSWPYAVVLCVFVIITSGDGWFIARVSRENKRLRAQLRRDKAAGLGCAHTDATFNDGVTRCAVCNPALIRQ